MASVGKFPTAFYNPKFLMGDTLSVEQLAEEYEKLAKLANDKLAKFEGTEWEGSNIYKRNAGKYIPLHEIESKRQLAYLLSDVHRYLNTKNNSVWALQRNRAATVRTLNEHGYTFINKKNFALFCDFMEYWRLLKLTSIYDSERVVDLTGEVSRVGADPEKVKANFEFYLQNIDEVEKIGKKRGGGKSSEDLQKGMENNDLYAEGSPTRSRKKRGNS